MGAGAGAGMGMNPYGTRPRKIMPDVGGPVGKEFPLMNGATLPGPLSGAGLGPGSVGPGQSMIQQQQGPTSAPATGGPQIPILDRGLATGGANHQSQVGQQVQQQQQGQQQGPGQSVAGQEGGDLSAANTTISREGGAGGVGGAGGGAGAGAFDAQSVPTAIFRPEGNWKEQLRLSHEADQAARAQAQVQGWESGSSEGEGEGGEEEEEEGEGESEVGVGSEAEEGEEAQDGKVWKAKRTLRKSV